MSKSEIISRLMDEMSSQNDWYLAAIGVLVTLTLFVSGFSIYAQLKLSDKQIKTLKMQIEKDLITKYRLQDIKRELDQTIINDTIRYENTINSEIAKLENGLYFEGYSVQMEYVERKIIIDMTSIVNSAIDEEIKDEIYNRSYSRVKQLTNKVEDQEDSDKWGNLFSQLLNSLLKLKEK